MKSELHAERRKESSDFIYIESGTMVILSSPLTN